MENEWAAKRLTELAGRAASRGRCTFTDFLGQAELDALRAAGAGMAGVTLTLYGGIPGCQRQMARFCPEGMDGDAESFPITCVRVTPLSKKFAETSTHRDILGALMSLGFERGLVGDIIVRENEAFVFLAARIAPYVTDNLREIRSTAVGCAVAAELPEGALYRLERVTVQAASPRLDAVIARVYGLSRDESQSLFPRGYVAVNGRECASDSHILKEDDVVSVRGYGRFIYRGIQSLSKKGKCNIAVDRYA
jgi:RNA-binding protein YlmH